MSIRFKFRSCSSFEAIEIDGRTISVRELKAKIATRKKLNIPQDFNLLFSDAVSGIEYNDENFLIESGSSVIVKRVPSETMPSTTKLRCEKLDPSDLNQAVQRGSNHYTGAAPDPKTRNVATLQKAVNSIFPAVPYSYLPVEMKCPLCNAFFKEAMMIPCCQHSFCGECIRVVLLEKAECPKCYSRKCKVENLLPNLSLRQAIDHLVESQMIFTESENALRRYAPDGESGIQVNDACCSATVVRQESEILHSPSATGKGSNQVMAESIYGSPRRKNSLSRTLQEMDGGAGRYDTHFPSVPDDPEDCQGESKPLYLPHSLLQDQGDSSIKRNKGRGCDTRGGDMDFLPASRVKRDRNCYMCGSPDHLIRDCPFASNPSPMLQTGNTMLMGGYPGYPSPCWNSNTYSTPRPFANMYTNAGIAPFNACMVPPTPFAPPYMQSMHGGMPLPGGIMTMGNMAVPAGNRNDLPLNQYGHMLPEDKRRIPDDILASDQYLQAVSNFKENYQKKDEEALAKSHEEREAGTSCSDGQRSQRKHMHIEKRIERSPHSSSAVRDKVLRHSDRFNSVADDTPHQHHIRKRHESDSARDHHKATRVDCHVRGFHQKHLDQPSSALEPSSHVHQKARFKEGGSGHDQNHSRHHARHSTRRMSSSSYEFSGDDYQYHKRKRVHRE